MTECWGLNLLALSAMLDKIAALHALASFFHVHKAIALAVLACLICSWGPAKNALCALHILIELRDIGVAFVTHRVRRATFAVVKSILTWHIG